nr:hypothetical protein [Pseudaminobacter manganicus]
MPDPRKRNPDEDVPVPGREPEPIEEPDPDRLPDEEPNPNPDETRNPPLHGMRMVRNRREKDEADRS